VRGVQPQLETGQGIFAGRETGGRARFSMPLVTMKFINWPRWRWK
jgi:hypothetical protein